MSTAVVGDGLVNGAKLLFDDAETVGDELVGGSGYLVLVLDPVLVIDVDDHPQDILGTLGIHISIIKVDYGGILAVKARSQAAAARACGILQTGPGHIDSPVKFGFVRILRAGHNDITNRSSCRIPIGDNDGFALHLVLAFREVFQPHGCRINNGKCKAGTLITVKGKKLDLHG